MKKLYNHFIKKRIYSLQCAFKGLLYLIRTETHIKIHLVNTLLFTLIGLLFKINLSEWAHQFLALGMVMCVEAINTIIEKLADYIQPNFDKKIGLIKDLSAGAVLFSVIYAAVVVGLIYIPKILQFIRL